MNKNYRLYSWDYVVQLYTWTENWANWNRQQKSLVSKHKECKNFQKPNFFGKELKSFKAKQENTKRREIKIFHSFLAEMEIFAQVQWTGDFYRYNRHETICLLNNASITGTLEAPRCLNIVALPSQKKLFWGEGDVWFSLYLIVQYFLAQIEQNWTLNVVHSSKKQNQFKWWATSLDLNKNLWWKYN